MIVLTQILNTFAAYHKAHFCWFFCFFFQALTTLQASVHVYSVGLFVAMAMSPFATMHL